MPFIIMIPNIIISTMRMWELIGLSGAGSAGARILPLGNASLLPLLLLSRASTPGACTARDSNKMHGGGTQASLLLFICIIHTTYLNHLDSLPKRLDYFGDNYVT